MNQSPAIRALCTPAKLDVGTATLSLRRRTDDTDIKQLIHRNLSNAVLVHRCINFRVISTRCLRHCCVVVSQRCHRIASFLRLALTQTSGTDYFKINATMYQCSIQTEISLSRMAGWIWHGNEYNKRGEAQLSDYLDHYHQTKGYMVSFNFNKTKECGVRTIRIGGKRIVEAVV